MTIVAIHQPNYLPWLGYFYKIRCADIFIFLDDAQYSKNSFTNRVRVLNKEKSRWLTIPVSFNFGDSIGMVTSAVPDWPKKHLDSLRGFYGKTPYFREVWPDFEALYDGLEQDYLANINIHLIRAIADHLKLQCRFVMASSLDTAKATGDDRLITLTNLLAPGGCYLSGAGGANYQDPAKFEKVGLRLQYQDFKHPQYEQQATAFVAGLSVVDAVFNLGWRKTAELLSPDSP